MARSDEEEYSTYCDEEQRSRAGWIVAPIGTVIFGRGLSLDRVQGRRELAGQGVNGPVGQRADGKPRIEVSFQPRL